MAINPIDQALNGTDDDLDFYLSEVKKDDFRRDIASLKAESVDKGAIMKAVEMLQALLQ